ncbi:MAG: TrkA C-terminal domain-containing protein [Nitrososphaerota archaeon]|nr:potassium channel protein [Candidatus Bathyarchaeota archaeon]MDW8194060.1 TrkA C-terminal domain-containing protein [Nitrososphaerota archaeon]
MPLFEKVEYRPVPVRDLLLEMKNLSELMIDLAYSAALFNDRELAEEVLELEKQVDNLAYLLHIMNMIAARDARDAESLVGVSIVASAADKISDAAADIAAIVTRNIGVHSLVSEIFERVEKRLIRAKVPEKSIIVGKTIGELNLPPRMGIDILAILRGKNWIINPKEDEKIHAGDILIARGAPEGLKEFKEICEGIRGKMED